MYYFKWAWKENPVLFCLGAGVLVAIASVIVLVVGEQGQSDDDSLIEWREKRIENVDCSLLKLEAELAMNKFCRGIKLTEKEKEKLAERAKVMEELDLPYLQERKTEFLEEIKQIQKRGYTTAEKNDPTELGGR